MKKVLLITEAGGAGVLSSLEHICYYLGDQFTFTVLLAERDETPSAASLHERFKNADIHVIRGRAILKIPTLFIRYYQVIRHINPDVIHLHSSMAGIIGRVAAVGSGARVLYSPHCFAFLRTDVSKITRRLFFFIEYVTARFSGELVAVSEYERSIGVRLGYKKTHVVYNTLMSTYSGHSSLHAFEGMDMWVGTVGRLSPQKNPWMFIHIAERVVQDHPNVKFIWIGGGPLEKEVREYLLKNDLSNNIFITGWMNRDEAIRELDERVQIYVHTADWEAHPISVLEALSHAKPILIKEYGGAEELVQDGQNGFVLETKDDFVIRLKQLIENNQLAKKMGASSRQWYVDKFSPQKSMETLKKIYGGVDVP